jgi:SAM-dependent methyltransferase
VSTPQLSDASELLSDIVGWDVRTWSSAVRYWDSEIAPAGEVLSCLEVGAGPGGPSLLLALKGHSVVCSDQSGTELHASPLHERYGVTDRVTYRDIDVTAIPLSTGFDIVIFKSVLGGVGTLGRAAQEQAVSEILRVLKPGGRLFFAENLRGTFVHRIARAIAYRIRGTSWAYPTLADVESLLAGFSHRDLTTTGVVAMFGVTEGQRRALAGLDKRFFNRITPASCRYVVYGVAVK